MVLFLSGLEPDGYFGHWMEISDSLIKDAGLSTGDSVFFKIEPIKDWPNPPLPRDLEDLLKDEALTMVWESLTAKAKWEWIRWIRFTKNQSTRYRRIDILVSKLKKGDKRPCCFNTTACTITEVSKGGKLILGQEKST